jgi:hypothetical protein
MMKRHTYESAGWDFDNVWYIDEGMDYPKLQVFRRNTGIEEQVTSITISPNPAGDYIDVMLNGVKEPVLSVKVYDVLGTCVRTHPLAPSQEGETIRIDVSGLAAGVYFVRVGGKMYKFVKL